MRRIDNKARRDPFATTLTLTILAGGVLLLLAWIFRVPWVWF
jgi:hypothetical protein